MEAPLKLKGDAREVKTVTAGSSDGNSIEIVAWLGISGCQINRRRSGSIAEPRTATMRTNASREKKTISDEGRKHAAVETSNKGDSGRRRQAGAPITPAAAVKAGLHDLPSLTMSPRDQTN